MDDLEGKWERGYLQNSNAKHQHDVDLLLQGKRQPPELRHRNAHDDYIERNVDARMRPSENVEVDAFAGMLAIPTLPDVRDWQAVEETHNNEREPIGHADTHKEKDCHSKLFAREDAEAEEEEGDFRKSYSREVEYFCEPCELHSS
jgi:hypothetical protein